MKLRFQVPVAVLVIGSSADALGFRSTFQHSGLLVEVSAEGDAPLHSDELPAEYRHFYMMREIVFYVTPNDEKESTQIARIIDDQTRWPQLVGLLTSIANRVLRSIRNFGSVPYINEVNESVGDLQSFLGRWKVSRQSAVDHPWELIVPAGEVSGGLVELLSRLGSSSTETPQMRASEWRIVDEAIQEDQLPGPEREFLVNAIELLRVGNLRMAVMESVIGLEIALARYLNSYLRERRGLPAARVKAFVNPQLGLTDRIAVLLDLTIGDRLKGLVTIDDVLVAVRMRNHVVHKTGHLDPNTSEETIRNGVSAVLTLTDLLANECFQIEMDPRMKSLAQEIANAHRVPAPTIRIVRNHRRLIEFWFVGRVPEELNLDAICTDAGKRLVAIDKWFDPKQDLLVRFEQFPSQLVATWHHGELHRI